MSNRHVPFIIGTLAIVGAVLLVVKVGGAIGVIGGAVLTFVGWVALKQAAYASDREIGEFTGGREVSEQSKKDFENRL